MTGLAISRSNAARLVRHFATDQRGATAIEYAMIAAGVGVAISSTVWGLGSTLKTNWYDKMASIFG
jgi:pilus assembly protein Flp/PilA